MEVFWRLTLLLLCLGVQAKQGLQRSKYCDVTMTESLIMRGLWRGQWTGSVCSVGTVAERMSHILGKRVCDGVKFHLANHNTAHTQFKLCGSFTSGIFLFDVFGMQPIANIRNDRKCEDQGLVYFISTFLLSTLHSTHQRQMCGKSHALRLEYSQAMVIILLTTPATSSSHRTWLRAAWNCFSASCNRNLSKAAAYDLSSVAT